MVKDCARIACFRQFIAGPLSYKSPVPARKFQKFGGGAEFCRAVGAISCVGVGPGRTSHRGAPVNNVYLKYNSFMKQRLDFEEIIYQRCLVNKLYSDALVEATVSLWTFKEFTKA